MIKKLIKKEKKQLIALFISLISLIIFSLLDNKIDKIFLFFFIGDLIIIFVDVCLKNIGKIKKIKNSILKETFIDRTVFIRSETVRSSMSLFCDGNKLRSGQPRTSATVYNREMCLLALQTIAFYSISFLNSSPLFALKYAGAISNTVLHPL